jgi:cell division protein FtsL
MVILLAKPVIFFLIAFVLLIVFAIFIRAFYSQQIKSKVKEYQSEIARSHSRILKLEVKNEKLQQQINELEMMMNRSKIA